MPLSSRPAWPPPASGACSALSSRRAIGKCDGRRVREPPFAELSIPPWSATPLGSVDLRELSVDGSQIAVQRVEVARCCVVRVGISQLFEDAQSSELVNRSQLVRRHAAIVRAMLAVTGA